MTRPVGVRMACVSTSVCTIHRKDTSQRYICQPPATGGGEAFKADNRARCRTRASLALPAVPGGRKHAVALTAVLTLLATGCGGGQSSTNASSSAAPNQPGAATPPAKASTPALIPPPGAPPHSVRVPVLTYHRVHTMPAVGQPDLIVDPANFAAELEALRASGYHTIHQSQLFDAL